MLQSNFHHFYAPFKIERMHPSEQPVRCVRWAGGHVDRRGPGEGPWAARPDRIWTCCTPAPAVSQETRHGWHGVLDQ